MAVNTAHSSKGARERSRSTWSTGECRLLWTQSPAQSTGPRGGSSTDDARRFLFFRSRHTHSLNQRQTADCGKGLHLSQGVISF